MTAQSLRGVLIDRALDLLDAGDTELSLRGLARAAGVSAMAPYRHFADRAALMQAIAEAGFDRLRDRLAAADAGADAPVAALVAQGLAYIAFAHQHPILFRLMFSDELPAERAGCGDIAYTVLADRVASLGPSDPEAATIAAWGLVHGLATLMLDGRLPPDPAGHTAALRLLAGTIAGQG